MAKKRKKKYEVKIFDWAKFGAVYGAIVGTLLAIISGLVAGLLFDSILLGLVAGAGVLLVSVIISTIGWTVNGIVYKFVRKYLQSYSVYWQVIALGLLQSTGINFLQGTWPPITLWMVIAALIGSWLVLLIAGFFKLKIPIKQVK